VGLVTGTKS